MSAVKVLLLFVAVLIGVALLGAGCAFRGYNTAIGYDQDVKAQWAQVENQLQRRFDLYQSLEATVKGVAGQEQEVFGAIADARSKYLSADRTGSVSDKAQAASDIENVMSRARSQLLVLFENYPQLRSSESFMKFQDSIEGTENRLAVERNQFNETVRRLNTFARQFPGKWFANLAGVEQAKFYEAPPESKAAPKVDFSDIRRRRDQPEGADRTQPAPTTPPAATNPPATSPPAPTNPPAVTNPPAPTTVPAPTTPPASTTPPAPTSPPAAPSN